MKAVIVEDEPYAQKEMEMLLKEAVPDVEVLRVIESVEEGLEYFRNGSREIDLVFMDIQLADGNSFDIVDQVEFTYPVIFTTAYNEFALKAFELNSIDYLLKPVELDKLKKAIGKWKTNHTKNVVIPNQLNDFIAQMRKQVEYKTHFLIKIGEHFKRLDISSIAYFKSDKNDVECTLQNGKHYPIDYSLDELERLLNPKSFFRINRSYVVAIEAIGEMQKYGNGQISLALKPQTDERVLVSRSKYNGFLNWMGK